MQLLMLEPMSCLVALSPSLLTGLSAASGAAAFAFCLLLGTLLWPPRLVGDTPSADASST
jgi:hypothetical protein